MAMTYDRWAEIMCRLDSKGWHRVISGTEGVMLSLTRKGRTFNIYVGYNGDMLAIPF